MKKLHIGVMGPGDDATESDIKIAYELGELIAKNGWILLSGGRNVGVMNSVSKGAKLNNGLVIGILPHNHEREASEYLDIVIKTDMGQARNNINVLTADIIIACGSGSGTVSEVALGVKADKHVILINAGKSGELFFKELTPDRIHIANTAQEVIGIIGKLSN